MKGWKPGKEKVPGDTRTILFIHSTLINRPQEETSPKSDDPSETNPGSEHRALSAWLTLMALSRHSGLISALLALGSQPLPFLADPESLPLSYPGRPQAPGIFLSKSPSTWVLPTYWGIGHLLSKACLDSLQCPHQSPALGKHPIQSTYTFPGMGHGQSLAISGLLSSPGYQ